MSKYFEHHPTIEYNKKICKDISKKLTLPENLQNDPYIFLPYTVEENEKPEDIAFHYYGSVEYTWLVYFSNNIIDPYSDWIMDDNTFNKYLMKKYEEQSNTKGYDVIHWTKDNTIQDNILYYGNLLDNDIKISRETYDLSDNLNASEWKAYRIYEVEHEENEAKRLINLVNKDYRTILKDQLKKIMKG